MTVYLNALGLNCALGMDPVSVARGLAAGDNSGLSSQAGWIAGRAVTAAPVRGELPALPQTLASHHSRNNQLLLQAAQQIEPLIRHTIARFGPQRLAVVLGTSTSGIDEASQAIGTYLKDQRFAAGYDYRQQELAAPAEFLAQWLQTGGPAYVISTACTSSARALMSARRLLDLGICDAVLCGGVDSLCRLTLNGFSALEAVSQQRCNPFSRHRDGINIGEGAALFLMTRERLGDEDVALLGAGASSDAHHISAPHPSGQGAMQAMHQALAGAGLGAEQIGYLNLHGTATRHNDAMESIAVKQVFGDGVPCSSTKALTGHTLGAAGALEAAFCWLALQPGAYLPPHVWDGCADPQLPTLDWVLPGQTLASSGVRRVMSNSFAFGGNNVSLILGDLS